MKKTMFLVSLAVVLGLVLVGCPQPTDGGNGNGNGGGETPVPVPLPMQMVILPAGEFWMGSTEEEVAAGTAHGDEDPERRVTLNSFMLSSTEVTEAQWEAVMTDWPEEDPASGVNHPARYVSWYDAIKFCNQLSINENFKPVYYTGESYPEPANITKETQLQEENGDAFRNPPEIKADFSKDGYRLPTEAEWEYAAGGAQERPTIYAGTNVEGELSQYEVFGLTAIVGPSTVQSKLPLSSAYALYDMGGNVFEWCYDWYGSYDSAENNTNNPVGPASISSPWRVFRGGNWETSTSDLLRVANRSFMSISVRTDSIGFRVARNAD